ncbi:hypothetical protein AVEN_189414-1 [Araneus ventricosus]|uniref:Uncharacterized protein n=1 Tax=Araneus ventricosus TaxID=182803 RepID=A0A4Y2H917_ARAVE|nr:hypothetical protein AVEN_189414-1 [Araneus ventricosus]
MVTALFDNHSLWNHGPIKAICNSSLISQRVCDACGLQGTWLPVPTPHSRARRRRLEPAAHTLRKGGVRKSDVGEIFKFTIMAE